MYVRFNSELVRLDNAIAKQRFFLFFFSEFYLCVQVFKHYFEELEEESLRDNFVVVVMNL